MQGHQHTAATHDRAAGFEPTWRCINAEARERARIGALMHDEFGQCLAIISFALDRWSSATEVNARQCIAVIRDALARLDQSWRQALLSPEPSKVPDLLPALKELCDAAGQEMQLHCTLNVTSNAIPPTPAGGLVLLRGVSELLLNVYKHAGCSIVDVRLDASEPWVEVSVRDHGGRLVAPIVEREQPRGFGLTNLKHELRLVGGDMRIDAFRVGREVRLRVPSLRGGRNAEAGT